ncbi:hypothetical protein L6Q79_01030 [bacterium]|nr:hypothetical protein [bacterium]NUN45491.1 hypothetical protein [bacterium]
MDFSNITFASMAAADQSLKEKPCLNKNKIEMDFVNMNADVTEMLNRVSKNTQKTVSELRNTEMDQHKMISVLSRLFHKTI